jgi:hypothetical protein
MASLREWCRRGVRPLVSPFVFACDTGEKWRTLTVLDLKAKGKIRRPQKAEDPLIGVYGGRQGCPHRDSLEHGK